MPHKEHALISLQSIVNWIYFLCCRCMPTFKGPLRLIGIWGHSELQRGVKTYWLLRPTYGPQCYCNMSVLTEFRVRPLKGHSSENGHSVVVFPRGRERQAGLSRCPGSVLVLVPTVECVSVFTPIICWFRPWKDGCTVKISWFLCIMM